MPRGRTFNGKRQLNSTKIMITETESLTKRRTELLLKARAMQNIATTWSMDELIVGLLANGKNTSITTEQQLRGLADHLNKY